MNKIIFEQYYYGHLLTHPFIKHKNQHKTTVMQHIVRFKLTRLVCETGFVNFISCKPIYWYYNLISVFINMISRFIFLHGVFDIENECNREKVVTHIYIYIFNMNIYIFIYYYSKGNIKKFSFMYSSFSIQKCGHWNLLHTHHNRL